MYASTISRVEGDEEAIRTLTWLGGSFFSDTRLARFALSTRAQISNPDDVNWRTEDTYAGPKVELWSIRDDANTIIGAMTLHYYSWSRLRKQRYFGGSPIEEHSGIDRLYVRPFERIVAGMTGSIAPYDVAVELGYVAVAEPVRGYGLGRTLFDIFLHRASAVSYGRALAFTIVMAKHAHSDCGHALMSHLIGRGAKCPLSAIDWRHLADRMALPTDLFEVEATAFPTAWMAQQRGFTMTGYGKNLGQVWVRDMAMSGAVSEATPPVGQPLLHLSRPAHLAPAAHIAMP